jgi:hypothetical protein
MTLPRLNVSADEWRAEDISAVRDVLAEVDADPALARDWRGSVVLTFAEAPESYPYLNQSIVAYLKNLYPDRVNGALDGFFASIDALSENDYGVWLMSSDDAATALYQALAATAEFAIKTGR